jgi:hypothetical protein
MANRLRAVPIEFLETAPKRWAFEAPVAAPQGTVFAAISADPSTWTWFPGITGGGYSGNGSPGVGTIREARMGPTIYRETMLAWDEPSRWVYRVDEMTVPLAHALVEEWLISQAGNGSVVRWTFAIDPKPLFSAGGPAVPRVMGTLFRKSMRNLSASLNSSSKR